MAPAVKASYLIAPPATSAGPVPYANFLQNSEAALSCALMCAWDWDIRTNEIVYSGDPNAVFGCIPEPDYERGFRTLVHPGDIEQLERKIHEMRHTDSIYQERFRVVHPDGSVRLIHFRGRFLHDETGSPIHLVGVSVDITDQKQANPDQDESQRVVQAPHALLDTIVNHIPVMLCYMREPGRVHWANRAWREILGWSPDDNDGETAPLLYPDPQELQRVREFIARADGKPDEFRTRTKVGETLETRWLNVVLADGTNIGIGRDVSVEKKAERELRESERRFRMLSDNIPQIVWITDPAGATIYMNKRWYTYTGLSPDSGLGYAWNDIIHPDDLVTNRPLWEKANQEGTNYENEVRLRGQDGEYRWFLVRGTPIRGENGAIECWFGTNTDITEKKLAHEALIRAEKLALAGRFAATVAHEVNNPLTAVTNIHYMLSLNDSLPADVRELLKTADNELHRVSHILRQTLAFYREHGAKEPVRPRLLMREVAGIFSERLAKGGIRLESEIPEDIDFIASSGEIRQILCNLIANALDAAERGDRIVVRAREVRSSGPAPHVKITVADTGCGIPSDHLKRIFEPFFTSKAGSGTGLGLWVSKQLVERNQGSMRVRSRSGQGTVFVLRFPQA